jgi:hypothetical protein
MFVLRGEINQLTGFCPCALGWSGDRRASLTRRRRGKPMTAVAGESPCWNLPLAVGARFGPRLLAGRLLHVLSRGFTRGACDRIGACHGALRMHACPRIRRLTAYRAKCSRWSHVDGNGFSLAHVFRSHRSHTNSLRRRVACSARFLTIARRMVRHDSAARDEVAALLAREHSAVEREFATRPLDLLSSDL